MTTLRFYIAWFKLGRSYWKHRHIWTLLKWMENLDVPASMGDQVEAWLAEQDKDEA